MCRSIRLLRRAPADGSATPDEVAAASLQFIRKVSGFRAPSKTNQAAFDAAVTGVARITAELLQSLEKGKTS